MNESSMHSPYKGLIPYAEEDAPFFFGRAAEQEIIIANMNVSRLTLLYGASGVGKSSILRAGIAHQLRQEAQRNLTRGGTPEFGVVVFSSWRDDPVLGLVARVQDEVTRTLGNGHADTAAQSNGSAGSAPVGASPLKPASADSDSSLAESLRTLSDRVGGDLYIILDQFEEYFLYHPDDSGEGAHGGISSAEGPRSFADEFARVLTRQDLRVNFLLAIREDALAKLDRFKGRIPNLFDNYLRMEHLDPDAAREAIVKPLDEYNRLHANGDSSKRVSIEPALVEAVLEQTRTGQVIVGEAGRGAVRQEGSAEIETPYLQLVMTRLWDEEQRAGSNTLRLETLERLGGAEKIVRTHLDTTMSALPPHEQAVAASIFNFLVTPSGTKIAHTAQDLAGYAHVPAREIEPTLEKLSSGDIRILRPVAPPLDQPNAPRYEIFHDVLGAPILDWRTRFVQQQDKVESEKRLAAETRRVRRLRFGLVGLSLLLLAVIALAVFALTQRQEAERASAEAEAQRAEALLQRDAAQQARGLAEEKQQEAQQAQADALAQSKNARSGELAALALTQLESDPERALLIAKQAMDTAQTTQAEDALRTVLLDAYRLTFKGNGEAIQDALMTPDGKYVVTLEPCIRGGGISVVGNCGTVRVWDAQTGELVSGIPQGNGARTIDLSLDGRYLVTANADAVARVWEIPSGKLVSEMRGHKGQVRSALFSPDGMLVVTVSDDETARVWNTLTGELAHEIGSETLEVIIAKFSPDGKSIVIGTRGDVQTDCDTLDNIQLRRLDPIDGIQIVELQCAIDELEFSPDSQFLAVWASETSPSIFSLASRNRIGQLKEGLGPFTSLAFSPDSTYILTGSQDGNLRVYDALTAFNVATVLAHARGVNDAVFSADGKNIVSAGGDNRARWWEFKGRDWVVGGGVNNSSLATEAILEPLQDLNGHTAGINSVAISIDRQTIVTAGEDGTARAWHVNAGETLAGHTDFVGKAVFSPDGTRVATASSDGTTRIWDVATHQTLHTLAKPSDARKAMAYSADGAQFLTVNADGVVQLWDSQTGERIWELSDPALKISGAILVPNSPSVATFGTDYRLRLWNTGTGEEISDRLLYLPDLALAGITPILVASPDGTLGAISPGPDTIKLFDPRTGQELGFLRGGGWNGAIAFSPDGAKLAVAYSNTNTSTFTNPDGGFQVWDISTRKALYDIRGRFPSSIAFSPDGKYIVTTYNDETPRLWDAGTGRLIHELQGHTAEINRAAFSPDGRFIVTASNDRTARVWETATGKLVEILRGHIGIVTDASFSPDGKTIATTGDNTARLFECVTCAPFDELLSVAAARITRELTCEERRTFLHDEVECTIP